MKQQIYKGLFQIQSMSSTAPKAQSTKQFFTQLGNELCNFKNSPFYRLGQAPRQQQNSQALAYAPNRLFNPEKHIEQINALQQQDYKKRMLENEQKQRFKIQYDLLKRNTNEQYAREVEKMKQMRRFDHKQPFTWFSVYRGACLICGRCGEYEGCFSPSQFYAMGTNQFLENAQYNEVSTNKVQLMQCYKCRCPMNSHVALPHSSNLRHQFYKALIHKNIEDNYLKFNHVVLAFKVPEQNLQHFHHIVDLLSCLNCPVVNFKSFTKLAFELALVKSTIIQKGNTEKSYVQTLLNLIECIRMEKQWKWNQSKMNINQIYQELYDTVKKVGIKIEGEMGIGERECVVVVLCRYQIEEVRKLIRYLSGHTRVPGANLVDRTSINSTNASSVSSNRNLSQGRNNFYGSDPQQTDMAILEQKFSIKFIYGTNQRKESVILSQYFFKENYEILYNLFMLPNGSLPAETGSDNIGKNQEEHEYNSARFKDILDYNQFILFLQNFREVDRVEFQDVMKKVGGFRTSKIDYLIGEQLLNKKIKKLGIKLAVKIGISKLTIPFDNIPDFIAIKNTNKMQIPKILKVLHPQFTYSQRCVFIIRPFVMNSNFQEVIVNLLRINKFVLLRRIQVKLSEGEARYLATLEGIEERVIDEYVKYMTAGVCQIILTSKRAAIYEAFALANGCLNGPSDVVTKSLKNVQTRGKSNTITVQVKKNRQVYEQQLPLYNHSHESRNINFPSSTQVFKSVRELIDIEKVVFGYNYPPQFATNIRNGEISRIDPSTQNNPNNTNSSENVSHKIKQSMLKELKKENFNFWMFTSKSETLTEQLAGIFLPECTLFEPIIVLVKPGLIHLVSMIRKALLQHKYHIIVQKQFHMSSAIATEFVYNCQKIRIPNETMKYIIDAYTKQKVYIFCLSKISGRKEIMSMLSGFTFLTNMAMGFNGSRSAGKGSSKEPIEMFAQDEFISDQMLYDMLVPVWNNEELCLRMIAEPLANLEESIRIICELSQGEGNQNTGAAIKKPLLKKSQKLIVLNYLVGSFFGVTVEDLNLNTKLGKLSILLSESAEVPRLQSWYYAQISNIRPNYVPLLFQYRQIGQTMVCLQSDKGAQFMQLIIKMYNEELEKIKAIQEHQLNSFSLRPTKKNQRRSLVLFLWGKKLSELCLDLCQIKTQLNDFGEIVFKNGEFRGEQSLQQAQGGQASFLNRLYHQFDNNKQIKMNIKKLLDSRQQKQRYVQQNKRLLPSFSLSKIQQCIRIIEKTQTSKLNLMDKYAFVDPENEASKEKDLYSFHLFNVVPEIRTKYSMIAEIYYFFVRAEFENAELSQMISELEQIFSDLLTDIQDLQVLEFEIYLRFLIEYVRIPLEDEFKNKLLIILKSYPNLRKNKKIERDDVGGKKRKMIDHKQYFRRKEEQNDEAKQIIEKKYIDFDLNSLKQQVKPSVLYDPKDPLHYRFAHSQNRVNLLREARQDQQRVGVYVEFQKNISEKEELLKQKIKREAERFNYRKEEQILHETGLQKDLWYRRTKGEQKEHIESKTNTAIQKQIQKLMSFKQLQDNNK